MNGMHSRFIKTVGHGLIICRDFSMGKDTPKIPESIVDLAEMNIQHADACRVYINRLYAGGSEEFRYSLGHRGIAPIKGHELIAEFEFVAQN
jgi:hypothetical protein